MSFPVPLQGRPTPALPPGSKVEISAVGRGAHLFAVRSIDDARGVMLASSAGGRQKMLGSSALWNQWALGTRRVTSLAVRQDAAAIALSDGSLVIGRLGVGDPQIFSCPGFTVPSGCLQWADTGLLAAAGVGGEGDAELVLVRLEAHGPTLAASKPLLNAPVQVAAGGGHVAVLDALASVQLYDASAHNLMEGTVLPDVLGIESVNHGVLITREPTPGNSVSALHSYDILSSRRVRRGAVFSALAALATETGVVAVERDVHGNVVLVRHRMHEEGQGTQRSVGVRLYNAPIHGEYQLSECCDGRVSVRAGGSVWAARV